MELLFGIIIVATATATLVCTTMWVFLLGYGIAHYPTLGVPWAILNAWAFIHVLRAIVRAVRRIHTTGPHRSRFAASHNIAIGENLPSSLD